jgi:hypothetical protein
VTKRRRVILVVVLMLLPLGTAGIWARSYWRRDQLRLAWDRGESRRVVCRVYSSWGRVGLLSYSWPVDAGMSGGDEGPALMSGDRAATEAMAEEVRGQMRQAGIMGVNPLGFAYAQHAGAMASGSHVWTAAVVPWWAVTAATLAAPGYVVVRAVRKRRAEAAVGDAAGDGGEAEVPASRDQAV